ncbi:MAG: PDZ domain-containing protein, partial [Chitinophagales bacterium]
CIYYKTHKDTYKPFDFFINNIFINEKDNRYFVKSIAEDSAPFLAGLQKNDEILKVNNIRVENLNNIDVSSLLNRSVGKKIKVKYKRNNIINQCKYIIKPII